MQNFKNIHTPRNSLGGGRCVKIKVMKFATETGPSIEIQFSKGLKKKNKKKNKKLSDF